jgi:hypothetical protein
VAVAGACEAVVAVTDDAASETGFGVGVGVGVGVAEPVAHVDKDDATATDEMGMPLVVFGTTTGEKATTGGIGERDNG